VKGGALKVDVKEGGQGMEATVGWFLGGLMLGGIVGGATAWFIARARIHALREREQWIERQSVEQKTFHERAMAELQVAFRALSADALSQHTPEFLRLAAITLEATHEKAKGDLGQRQEAIQGLVRPLEEQLKIYQARLQQQEVANVQAQGEMKKQLELLACQNETLANETKSFREVLRSNQARGRWGEETLRRVVESAGMSAHCDFIEQKRGEDSRPDLVVRLPGGRSVVVDAKTPELNYLADLDSADAGKRATVLKTHVGKVRGMVEALSNRDYGRQFPGALDYVVLFLPAESLFSTALEGDPNLIVWAAEQHRIMLATPATLIALLRAVSVAWTQFLQTENAREIAEAAKEFADRVATFFGHFEKIRSGLAKANEAVDDAAGSYERMVRPSGERLQKLGVSAERKLKERRNYVDPKEDPGS